jgi:tripartite-type tricarboxylate transporter receptor subunit TctC
MHPSKLVLAGIAAALLAVMPAGAQTVDYKGKQIKLLIGFGPGGGYDQYGRIVATHMGRHLPGNPTLVPQNMPAAGSLQAANRIYIQAPKDGTEWGIVARDVVLEPLTKPGQGAMFDATKFSWLGSPDTETNICVANSSAGLKTAKDLFDKQLVVGSTGIGTGTYIFPVVLNGLVHTKFKIIDGYPSSADVLLAMERHEVEGICESYSSVMRKEAQAIKDGKVVILFWAGHPLPELKDIPHAMSLVTKDEDKQVLDFMYAGQTFARPFVAPPGLPAAVDKTLKDAFAETMKDPLFLADAERQKLEIEPVSADEVLDVVKKAYATPKPLIDRMAAILKGGAGN